jgi:hypothetical protein
MPSKGTLESKQGVTIGLFEARRRGDKVPPLPKRKDDSTRRK